MNGTSISETILVYTMYIYNFSTNNLNGVLKQKLQSPM